MKRLLEAETEAQDYLGNIVREVEEEADRNSENLDFCPCCGDILAEGHCCDDEDKHTLDAEYFAPFIPFPS